MAGGEQKDKKDTNFDEIYNEESTPIKKSSNTLEVDSYTQFDSYSFTTDTKFQDLVKLTTESSKFSSLPQEQKDKSITKLQGKYFKKYINSLFDYDEYLKYKSKQEITDPSLQSPPPPTPYSKSYLDVIQKLQNNEEPTDIKKVDDKPKSSKPNLTASKVIKKPKPWEKKKKEDIEETKDDVKEEDTSTKEVVLEETKNDVNM
jgi:hypothetical protein